MDQDSRRSAPQFVHEEEPGDGTVRTDKWVGAFERVLGDKGEALASDRSLRSRSLARTIKVTEENEADESRQSSFSEAGSSPSGESSQSYVSGRFHTGAQVDSAAIEAHIRPELSSTSVSSTASSSPSAKKGAELAATSLSTTRTGRRSFEDRSFNDGCLHASAPASSQSIISISQSSIVMNNVYINHAPGLHRLKFRNTLEQKRALVRLESDLGKSLTFMRRKRASPAQALDSICWPSNSVAWAQADGFSPAMLRDLRHMGANLEPSDSFIMEPGATIDVFLVLRPSLVAAQSRVDHEGSNKVDAGSSTESLPLPLPVIHRQDASEHSSPEPPSSSSMSSSSAGFVLSRERTPSQYSAFEIQGRVTVRAWALANVSVDPTQLDDANELETAVSITSTSSSRPPSFYESNTSSATSSNAPGTDKPDEAPQTITLPFVASCCRAQLGMTASRSTLQGSNAPKDASDNDDNVTQHPQKQGLFVCDFGDILVDQSEERIFSMHNLSEIECFWQARLEDADNMLHTPPIQLVSKATDQPIPMVGWTDDRRSEYCPSVLAPRSTLRLSINLLPREPCRDYEQIIALSNLHETSNSIRIVVRANILGSAKDDALSVLSGDVLDFGDCCGGHWTRQLLILKNPGDVVLDVAFSIQKGVEATFQLAELAPQPEEIQDANDHHELGSVASAGTSSDALALPADDGGSSTDALADDTRSSFTGSLLSERLEKHNRGEREGSGDAQSVTAADFARTPTTHPQTTEGADPPPFRLHGVMAPPPELGVDRSETGHDDLDASSNASQAGSQAGSPMLLSKSLVSLSSAQHRPSLMDHIRNEGFLGDSRSDGSGQTSSMASGPLSDSGRSRGLRTMPSASLVSRAGSSLEPRSVYQSGDDSEKVDDAASVKSDATALSADSRLGPFVAGSASHASSSASRSIAQYLGLRDLRSVDTAHSNQLEELLLRPGAEYRVIVSYRPPRGTLDDVFTAGRLTETKFRISLDYARSRTGGTRTRGGRVRKTILCYTRTCTSFISVTPKLVDFGEANVGTRKSANIVVKNHSELTARVDLRFDSKVLSMYRDEVAIPPLQTVELKVDFFPRRVNDAYRKQITVANLLNRHDDKIFEVRSKNVDQQRVSFHSLFYRILTPTGSNFIDFGDVNINSTRIRTFSIENCTASKLTLELSAAHPEDLTLYMKAPQLATSSLHGSDSGSIPSGARTPNRYGDFDVSEGKHPNEASELDSTRSRASKVTGKGADLKERFLETISVDSPASIRQENAVWRLAQRQSHVKKKAGDDGTVGQSREGSGTVKPKAPINMVSALKKGGKGRLTMLYGKSMTFKDRKLLSEFEYLDLCSGPPVDSKRIYDKSKRYQALEVLETGRKSKSSNLGRSLRAVLEATDGPSSSDVKSTKKPRSGNRQSASGQDPETPKKAAGRNLGSSPSIAAIKRESAANDAAAMASGDSKSPALTGKRQAPLALSDPTDVSKLSVNELIAAVEAQTSSLNTFFLGNPAAEERHVRTEVNLQREFQSAVAMGRLTRVSMLSMLPKSEQQIIAVYSPNSSTRPHVQGNARKQDSRIFLRLVDFDVDIVRASPDFASMVNLHRDELPVRDLMIKSTVCRSLLELGQPHINFGHVDKGDTKTRKILIQNRSEWALRYCIRKSGSIASGDIKLSSGRYGVVPGYGKREVEFIFSPSLSGQFQERLVVENVGDRDNNQTVVLKANIRKVSNFAVDPAAIDFGACKPGKLSSAESFVVSNTTSKSRTFNVFVDPHSLRLQRAIVDLVLTNASSGEVRGGLTKAEEEEIEHISQKLKIATRKGHEDKVRKYEKRMEELGVKPPSHEADPSTAESKKEGSDAESPAQSHIEEIAAASETSIESPASRLKRVSSSVTFGLAPNQSKRFLLRVRAHAVQTALGPQHSASSAATTPAEDFSVAVAVHEAKNKDETKIVTIRAKVELDISDTIEELEAVPLDSVAFTSLSAS